MSLTSDLTAVPLPCPVCGARIPADAPNGMCPRCLLAEGVSPEPVLNSVAETLAGSDAESSKTAAPLPSHLRYLGDYELLDEIARGGMGVVYRAKQASLSRVVAVKMILAGNLADESAVRRFRQEAAAAAALDHPHIVPIYEVGEQEGRHYFSMGYVPGSSLADRLKNGPLPTNEAAQLVLTIAEAVQYAHEQGVIHRDLKPANILLDEQGRPRVTDFGLAKVSSQDQSLTRTGQAVGTPGYMPPEQVQNEEIGPTADVYALGAILYALLTGRPPFQAATPLDTMLQVITAEPASPRTLNPAVPRDLETIALKCLEKRTEWRYQTAADLATELTKYLAGEPIAARPPGILERGLRWFGKQQRGVALVVTAAAASVVALVAGSWSYTFYQQSLAGSIRLASTTHERLAAAVLDLQGKEVIPVQSLPTRQPESLPAGEYIVRASDRQVLGDDFLVQVARGETRSFDLNLQATRLLPEHTFDGTWHVVHTRGTTGPAHLLFLNKWYVDLLDIEETGRRLENSLQDKAPLQQLTNFRPSPWVNTSYAPSGVGNFDFRPQVVAHPPNLDAGEKLDVIIAYRHQPVILAVSADTSKIFWAYAPESFSANQPTDLGPHDRGKESMYGAVLGSPLVVPDLDQDGTPDLVAAFVHIEPLQAGSPPPPWHEQPRRTIEAISAKTGQRIWQHDLPDGAFLPIGGQEIPTGCIWHPGPPDVVFGGGPTSTYFGNIFRDAPARFGQDASQVVVPWPPRLLGARGQERIVCVAGTSCVELNLQTGQPLHPAYSLGTLAVREPQFADVTGDGEPELIVVEALPSASSGATSPDKVKLHVRNLGTGEPLFPPQVHVADYEKHNGNFHTLPQWPVVEDLNGDGRAEIVIASGTSTIAPFNLDINLRARGGMAALEGSTGKPHWNRELDAVDVQLDQFLVGPDIDRDGWRELFVATLFSRRKQGAQLYVDALSGRDGRTLWINHVPLPLIDAELTYEVIGQLQWWNAGTDGWPQLLVPLRVSYSNQPLSLTCFSAGTGVVTRSAEGLTQPHLVDLNGDGANDFVVFQSAEERMLDHGGRLTTFLGTSPQPWRALGHKLQAADDYDGDGREDLLSSHEQTGPRTAISGATGRLLWERKDDDRSKTFHPLHADFNGDGVADFAGVDGHRGNPGQRLRCGCIPVRQDRFSGPQTLLLAPSRIGHTSVRAIWSTMASPNSRSSREMDLNPQATGRKQLYDSQYWLVVLNTQGKLRLRQQVSVWSDQEGLGHQLRITPAFADLNRDGCDDVIVPLLEPNDQRCLLVLDGRALEKELWKVEFPLGATSPKWRRIEGLPLTNVGDLNGDGIADLLFHLPVERDSTQYALQIHALDGRTGDSLPGWPWERTSADPSLPPDAVKEYSANPKFERTRPQPQVVQLGTERVVVTWHQGVDFKPARLLVLSSAGKLLWELPLNALGTVIRPWLLDVNGDGQVDCLVVNGMGVEAYDLAKRERLWKQTLTEFTPTEVLRIESRGDTMPPVALVAAGRNVFGVSTSDGSFVWRSVGLPDRVSVSDRPLQFLHHTDPQQLPLTVRGRTSDDVICRAFEPAGRTMLDFPRSAAINLRPLQRDPRYARQLPWTEVGRQPLHLEAPAYLASGFVFAILLLIVPVWTVRQLARRFSLGFLLILPAVIGLAILGLQLPVPQQPASETSWEAKWKIAVLMGMVLVAIYLVGRWAWLRQWQKLVAAAAAVAGVTFSLTIVYLYLNPLGPGEYFSADGWWQILIFGGLVASPVVIIGDQIQGLAQFLRAQWQRGKKRDMPVVPPPPAK